MDDSSKLSSTPLVFKYECRDRYKRVETRDKTDYIWFYIYIYIYIYIKDRVIMSQVTT